MTHQAILAGLAACALALLLLPRPTLLHMPSEEVDDVVPPGVRSLGLMAHHGEADGNLLEYVRQLAREFELVVLLTDRQGPVEGLPANCRVVLAPNHGGRDFGKWAFLLHNLGPRPALRRVGLFNDSVFVVRDVAPFFARAGAAGWEAWGMTRSDEVAPHIQSYFVVAQGERAVGSLLGFFRGRCMAHAAAPGYTKVALVREFELGLSAHLARAVPLHAFFSMDTPGVREALGGRHSPGANPSLCHWDVLVLDLGMPLMKKMRDGSRVPGGEALRRLHPEPAAATVDAAVVDARVLTPGPA